MSATVDFVMDYLYGHGTMWVSPIMRNGTCAVQKRGVHKPPCMCHSWASGRISAPTGSGGLDLDASR